MFLEHVQYTNIIIVAVKHNGNLTLDQMIEIARTMRSRSQARQLSGTLKEVLGTAQVSLLSVYSFVSLPWVFVVVAVAFVCVILKQLYAQTKCGMPEPQPAVI